MKLIHAALAASLVMAFSTAALAEGSSKATQLTEAQMAKIVAAGGPASVDKPDHFTTFVTNSGVAERSNPSSGRGFSTVNVFTCQSAC
jgi:hypothetical protein